MNPSTYREAEKLALEVGSSKYLDKAEVVLCPPFTWLTDLSHKPLRGLKFGAQDVFWEDKGAFTGEISPRMLKNSGVKYVIIGHSERRRLGETDEMVNKKLKIALKNGLKAILCVGESAKVRSTGRMAAKRAIAGQLKADLKGVKADGRLAVAYEPIWAVSTVRSAVSRDNADTPENAADMVRFISSLVNSKFRVSSSKIRVLYGGSVTSRNARSFLQYKEIGGALVGGASLKAEEFKKIVEIAK